MSRHIPPEIITSIFSRLPVKPLLRFRCLSKQWCSQIDSIDFIKLHLKQSIQTTSNFSLVAGGLGQLFHIDYNTLDKAYKIRSPLEYTTVLGSCNGVILLLGFGRSKMLALFNPATRTHRVVPDSDDTTLILHSGSYSYVEEVFGFGFDSVNNDFKIFSVKDYGDQAFNIVFREAKIYSSKSNSWKKMKDCPYNLHCKRVWGVPINGSLHTIVNEIPDDTDSSNAILAVDLALEDYRLMELPHLRDKTIIGISLDILIDCLCSVSVHAGFRTEIWMLKEYGVVESWTKLLTVAPPVVDRLAGLCTLGFSKDGDKVLLHSINSKFIWYDLPAKTLIDVPVRGLPSYFYVDVCVESLFKLDGMQH